MKVYFATDHAGFELKKALMSYVQDELQYDVEDCGPFEFDAKDDYPDFISVAAQAVSENPEERRAIIFGGSGQAEAICANRFPHVRAALFYGPVIAKSAIDVAGTVSDSEYSIVTLAREHNNANILSLGARFMTFEIAQEAIRLFMKTPFSGDERHVRRLQKIEQYSSGS